MPMRPPLVSPAPWTYAIAAAIKTANINFFMSPPLETDSGWLRSSRFLFLFGFEFLNFFHLGYVGKYRVPEARASTREQTKSKNHPVICRWQYFLREDRACQECSEDSCHNRKYLKHSASSPLFIRITVLLV